MVGYWGGVGAHFLHWVREIDYVCCNRFTRLGAGTVGFHFLSPWYFTPIASNWTSMDDTVTLTFVMTGLGFVLINLFIAYCII